MSCNSPIPDCIPCQDCPPSNVTYTLPECTQGEKCEEISSTSCVSYKGPHLPALGVLSNDRLMTILTKLHKVVNDLKGNAALVVQSYTATATPAAGTTTPLVINYLGLGPVYTSTPGATGSTTTITVGSTTGLVTGMSVEVVSGAGAFAAGTTVTNVVNGTTFTVSQAPTSVLSSAVVRAYGNQHEALTLTVVPNAPQTFKAFPGSVVTVSGIGTII
jgi:hypothetical protein